MIALAVIKWIWVPPIQIPKTLAFSAPFPSASSFMASFLQEWDMTEINFEKSLCASTPKPNSPYPISTIITGIPDQTTAKSTLLDSKDGKRDFDFHSDTKRQSNLRSDSLILYSNKVVKTGSQKAVRNWASKEFQNKCRLMCMIGIESFDLINSFSSTNESFVIKLGSNFNCSESASKSTNSLRSWSKFRARPPFIHPLMILRERIEILSDGLEVFNPEQMVIRGLRVLGAIFILNFLLLYLNVSTN